MQILNYTGVPVGITSASGHPMQVLNYNGCAQCEVVQEVLRTIEGVAIYKSRYSKVKGLPAPDDGYGKLYIVTKEVAEAERANSKRRDLLIGEELFMFKGAQFFKRLLAA